MVSWLAIAPVYTPTHAGAALVLAGLAVVLFAATFLPRILGFVLGLSPRYVYGVCGRCGYSLSGLPGPICPECGAGSRRVNPWQRVGGRAPVLLGCAAWGTFVYMLYACYGGDVDRYLLRLLYGHDSYSLTMLSRDMARGHYWVLPVLRRTIAVAVGLVGGDRDLHRRKAPAAVIRPFRDPSWNGVT
jgi:hypothetical protein